MGASSPAQLLQNLEALKVLPRITDELLEQIEEILGNKPEAVVSIIILSFSVVLLLSFHSSLLMPLCVSGRCTN